MLFVLVSLGLFNFLFLSHSVPTKSIRFSQSPVKATFVHSETCGPCFILSQTLNELERDGKLTLDRILAAENPEMCLKLSITSLPVLFLDFPDGRRLRLNGLVSKINLYSLLTS